jgi:PAS domain S-box-containing protein
MTAKVSKLETFFRSATGQAVLDAFAETTPAMLLIADSNGKILRESRFFTAVTGDAKGLTVAQLLETFQVKDLDGRQLEANESVIVRALNGEPVRHHESVLSTRHGEPIPVVTNGEPIRLDDGEIIGAITAATDLRRFKALERELRAAVAEKETLYRELAHRVKNHLQILTALVAMNARSSTLTTKEVCGQVKGQLQTVAAVYRGMDRAGVGERVEVRKLLDEVSLPYASDSVSVDVAVAPPDLTLTSEQAWPLSMLVNEAICNSYKHAFRDRGGRIQVSLRRVAPGHLRLEVADDGKGWGTEPGHTSHGLDLMRMFATQLQGELELSDRPQGGAMVAAELPETAG